MTTASIDQLAGVLRTPVAWEVNDLLETLDPDDLTTCELIGLLAILRAAAERTFGDSAPAVAPVLQLIPAENRMDPACV